ncbi:Ger(x)C family spore germination protein [Gracilibacillus oryzae]|uniref:Ger(X)C family spore germination protein n=1 Tax=Gracilibacillus oryzae TaxID=1672701 RepID=A0A7C8GTM8_9BACI|nr:Ger(x)C family spore germination protein [Gracilibacillus oryzae]KAB8137711.1 Ger(x)C family spore germination protein [Gracilibacillus oryzae]
MGNFLRLMSCSCLLILTGCWDSLPIDERGFVIGSAIDMAGEIQDKNYDITVTHQFVVPGNLSNLSQSGGGGGDKKAFQNISATGQSPFQITRNMLSLTDLIPNSEHLKILIISDEVAREPDLFSSVTDSFIRDHEMRREVKVMITNGKAKDLLENESDTEQLPSRHINNIMENNIKSLELIQSVRVGTLHQYLLNDDSYVLPLITLSGKDINYNGAAIFAGKSDQQVGTLSNEEIKGLRLVKGDITNGMLPFHIDGELMIYEINTANSSIAINTANPEKMDISITINTEGFIAEMFGSRSLLDQQYINKIEKEISKKIEQTVNNTVKKAQQELGIDFFNFSSILRQKHYDVWKKIEKDWEDGEKLFSQSKVNVTAKAIVRDIGASDKAKDDGME